MLLSNSEAQKLFVVNRRVRWLGERVERKNWLGTSSSPGSAHTHQVKRLSAKEAKQKEASEIFRRSFDFNISHIIRIS